MCQGAKVIPSREGDTPMGGSPLSGCPVEQGNHWGWKSVGTLVNHLLWVRHWPDVQEHGLNNVSKVRQIVKIKPSTEKLAFQFFMTRDRKRMFDRNELQNK